MASALLATSVGAFAQITHAPLSSDVQEGRWYALGVGNSSITQYVGVSQSANGVMQFKAIDNTDLTSLARVDSALWSVTPTTTGEEGYIRFVLTNKATGLVFSFDTKNAVEGDVAPTGADLDKASTIGGTSTQWKWYDSRFSTDFTTGQPLTIDFDNGDSTMVVKITNDIVYVAKEIKSATLTPQSIRILDPQTWIMSPTDLNTKGDEVKYMQLSFAGEANDNNVFTGKWQAQTITGTLGDKAATSPYYPFVTYMDAANQAGKGWSNVISTADDNTVLLRKVSDDEELTNTYLHVDTSYYESRGNTFKLYNKLAENEAKMTTGGSAMDVDTLGYNLPVDAYRFMFTKNLLTDSIKIETVSGFVEMDRYVTPKNQKDGKVTKYTLVGLQANLAKFGINTFNGAAGILNVANGLATYPADDVRNNHTNFNVLSHCTLEGETEKVITFWSDDATRPVENWVNLWAYADGIDDDYASVPDGVYTIKDAETGEYLGVHIYSADSLADFTGTQAIANMNFNHIPAFQWVVLKTDRASEAREAVSPLNITNREFTQNNYAPVQLRKGTEDGQYKFGLFGGREVIFEKVADEYISDPYLGYKYLADDTLDVNRYTFNYWHSYAQDKFISLNAEDSLLNVLTNDADRFKIKGNDDEEYGYTPNALTEEYIPELEQLVRRSYTVELQGVGTIYKNKEDQYMVTKQASVADAQAEFLFKENNEFTKDNDVTLCYYALIDLTNVDSKAGVVDNDEKALLWSQVLGETRTSVFAVEADKAPLYRRFNNTALGESVTDGRDSLRFYENARGEYLMDEANPTWQVEGMNYVGMWTADKAEAGLAFIVDSAWINRGMGYKKPQYLISVAHNDFAGIKGEECTEDGPHFDFNGNPTDAAHCIHAHMAVPGFQRAKYMISFADSASVNGEDVPYTDIKNGYTRVGFVEAIRVADTLWVLPAEFKALDNEEINFAELQAYNDSVVAEGEKEIKNLLTGDNHKNYTWSFRYVTPEGAANVAEEGEANQFLIESNNYDDVNIAPNEAAWMKIQNGCIVLTNEDARFTDAKTGGDGALIFNVNGDNVTDDDLATDNEEISTSEVVVIAGNGQITISGAAGKKVVVSNILGQVVANTVLTSDNATIAAPQGVVVVAVEGEDAVKAIVK